jgi:hypothetical protein
LHDRDLIIAAAVWVGFGLLTNAFFRLAKNTALKARLWPPTMIFATALFIGLWVVLGAGAQLLVLIVPVSVAIGILNIRRVRFCSSCGAMVVNKKQFLSPPAACSKCGAALEQ